MALDAQQSEPVLAPPPPAGGGCRAAAKAQDPTLSHATTPSPPRTRGKLQPLPAEALARVHAGLAKASPEEPKPAPPGASSRRTRRPAARLREAILEAGQIVGKDGKGQQGLAGYLATLASDEPKTFAGLLAKMLPTQAVDEEESLQVSFTTIYESRAD